MALEVVQTRYGGAALDALAAAVARAKDREPLRPVTVVVPSNYAGVAARRALARREGVVGVAFVTLYRLAELLAGPTLARSGRVPVSSPVIATAFRAALVEEPGLFGPVADQPSTVEALRRAHRELRDLDGEQRRRLADSDARGAAVVAVDERVTERLRSGWHDETDLMETAADLIAAGAVATPTGPVVVHLPQQLSNRGARLLLALAADESVIVVVGLTEGANGAVEKVLKRLGVAGDAGNLPVSPTAAEAGTVSPAVEVAAAADEDDEVRMALRRVIDAAQGGMPLDRMAIVYAPGAPYGRLLVEHLTAARVPWNGVAASSVAERVAGRALLGLLDLDPSLRRRDVFALLASVPPSRHRPVAAWERQARAARVVTGRHQWDRRLAARADELRHRAAHAEHAAGGEAERWRISDAEHTEQLRAFMATLAERLDPPSEGSWAAHARWARRLLEHVIGGPARQSTWSPDEQRAADRVERVLDRLARLDRVVAGDGSAAGVDRAVFRAALDAELADGPTTVGRLGEGVFVAPIPLAVGIDADLVIVLGLVEGALPGGTGDDPLLSERTRRALDGALTTAGERRDGLHHQLLAVADGARRTVVASRPCAELRSGTTRHPSRWLATMSARPELTRRHVSFQQGLHDGMPAASEQEAALAELHVVEAGGRPLRDHPIAATDPPLRRALSLLDARSSDRMTAYDGNLASLVAAGGDLSPRRPVSPTALEAWARCPFSYFMAHVLGVREVEAVEEELSLRSADRGVLVHSVLDAAVAELIRSGDLPEPGQPWSTRAQARLLTELDDRCAATEAEGEVGLALHWQLEQRRLRRRIDGFLDLDQAARAEHRVRPTATELAFGTERPFCVGLPDGRRLAVHGAIDRVDAGPDRVAVIDYKTGRARSGWKTDPFAGGVRLQLPIYGLAARELLKRPEAELVAEYWHLDDQRVGRARRVIDVDAATLARLADVLATIVDGITGGVFVAHPDEPDPWRHARCPYCDPDGADTATLWGQWQHKRHDPLVLAYRQLVEDEDDDGGVGP